MLAADEGKDQDGVSHSAGLQMLIAVKAEGQGDIQCSSVKHYQSQSACLPVLAKQFPSHDQPVGSHYSNPCEMSSPANTEQQPAFSCWFQQHLRHRSLNHLLFICPQKTEVSIFVTFMA